MNPAIVIETLWKDFPGPRNGFLTGAVSTVSALRGISLEIAEGGIFGLIGPNGAGKTTLIKILTTLILPTSGRASIYGHDVVRQEREVKRTIGLIHSDERSFYWRLTGRQNLDFYGDLFLLPRSNARKRIDELLSLVGLEEKSNVPFQDYSTGMKQKLAIARALLTYPKVLFMDEALRSIDPISTSRIRTFIKTELLRVTGGTVVMTTNRLDEASDLCDRIAILDKGNLLAVGTRKSLIDQHRNHIEYEVVVHPYDEGAAESLRRLDHVSSVTPFPQPDGRARISIRLANEDAGLAAVLRHLTRNGLSIVRCERIEPSLESVFETIVASSKKDAPCR